MAKHSALHRNDIASDGNLRDEKIGNSNVSSLHFGKTQNEAKGL
jgi:hypothetical protein